MKSKKTKIYSVILFLAMVIGICSPNGISRVNAEDDSYLITWVTTKGCMGHDFGEDDEEIPIMKTYTHFHSKSTFLGIAGNIKSTSFIMI